MKLELITISIVLVLSGITSLILYFLSLPGKAPESTITDEKLKVKNNEEYLNLVYNGKKTVGSGETSADTIVDSKELNFFWNNLPSDLQKQVPRAYNLSFEWPPLQGSRAKLTAFPYPKGGGQGWLVNFIKGIASLLDNTADQATFPGWLKSVYNPTNPNDNIFGNAFSKQLAWVPNEGPDPKQTPVYMEVTHACYAPPKYKYPTCDDGGYWLYLTAGSGVFWSSGSKCLVANNKIDAMLKMLKTPQGEAFLRAHPSPGSSTSGSGTKIMTPVEYLASQLKGTGGGYSLIGAMQRVIDAMQKGTQIPTLTAFRTMEKSSSFTPWGLWVSYTSLMVITALTVPIYIIISIVKSAKKQRPWLTTIIVSVCLCGLIALMWYIFYNFVSDAMLKGFGYMTLDMAVKKSGMNLEGFIENAATGKNMVANGLGMIQNFDFHLEQLASGIGLDSIIFHAQPNKSGSWSVEIIDVRNTPFVPNAKSGDDLIYKLGLCGNPLQGPGPQTKNLTNSSPTPACDPLKYPGCMPPLKQGPVAKSTKYIGFQPTKMCDCDEDAVKKQFDKDGSMKLCVFCKNTISDWMC